MPRPYLRNSSNGCSSARNIFGRKSSAGSNRGTRIRSSSAERFNELAAEYEVDLRVVLRGQGPMGTCVMGQDAVVALENLASLRAVLHAELGEQLPEQWFFLRKGAPVSSRQEQMKQLGFVGVATRDDEVTINIAEGSLPSSSRNLAKQHQRQQAEGVVVAPGDALQQTSPGDAAAGAAAPALVVFQGWLQVSAGGSGSGAYTLRYCRLEGSFIRCYASEEALGERPAS